MDSEARLLRLRLDHPADPGATPSADRFLMEMVLAHSSSDAARAMAAAWVEAYDAARAAGVPPRIAALQARLAGERDERLAVAA